MTDLAPISNRLAALLRMLSSDKPHEVTAAANALIRTLKSAGSDIHEFADRVEKLNGGALTEAEMRKLYDAGYAEGLRVAENKHHGSGDFVNVDGLPDWEEIARFCQIQKHRLPHREQEFVDSVASQVVWRSPSDKQVKWLRSIFYKLGGRIP
jgi:hypothetical protein